MSRSPRFALERKLFCVAALGGSLGLLVRASAERGDRRRSLHGREPRARGGRLARVAPLVRARRTHGVAPPSRRPAPVRREGPRARARARRHAARAQRSARATTPRPDVEHWHGATPDSEFTQVALGRGDAAETVWLDKVTDDEYAGR